MQAPWGPPVLAIKRGSHELSPAFKLQYLLFLEY